MPRALQRLSSCVRRPTPCSLSCSSTTVVVIALTDSPKNEAAVGKRAGKGGRHYDNLAGIMITCGCGFGKGAVRVDGM